MTMMFFHVDCSMQCKEPGCQEWNNECDKMVALNHILQAMESATNTDGNRLFEQDVIDSCIQRGVEGSLV